MDRHTTPDRRAFLRACGRLALLAVGAGGLARGVRSGRIAVNAAERCSNHGICSGCGRREACGLPAALSRRRALEQQT